MDWLKRRILFWRYKIISISLEPDTEKFIRTMAKKRKVSVDQFIETCLEHHISNIK